MKILTPSHWQLAARVLVGEVEEFCRSSFEIWPRVGLVVYTGTVQVVPVKHVLRSTPL